MAVRVFDGTDDLLTLGGGSLGALCNGAYTVVLILKPTTLATSEVTFALVHSSGFLNLTIITTGGGLRMVNDLDDCSSGDIGITTAWHVLGMSKASGTVAPRFHSKALGAGSWTHVNSGATGTNRTQSISSILVGGGNDEFYDSRIACVALFNTELSDANFESIQTTPSTQQLADLGAVAIWDLNQAATTTAVEDLVGTADQTALVGTTVATGDDPPSWTFGLSGGGGEPLVTKMRQHLARVRSDLTRRPIWRLTSPTVVAFPPPVQSKLRVYLAAPLPKTRRPVYRLNKPTVVSPPALPPVQTKLRVYVASPLPKTRHPTYRLNKPIVVAPPVLPPVEARARIYTVPRDVRVAVTTFRLGKPILEEPTGPVIPPATGIKENLMAELELVREPKMFKRRGDK